MPRLLRVVLLCPNACQYHFEVYLTYTILQPFREYGTRVFAMTQAPSKLVRKMGSVRLPPSGRLGPIHDVTESQRVCKTTTQNLLNKTAQKSFILHTVGVQVDGRNPA